VTFAWATDAPDPKNWIGVYDGNRQPGSGGGSLVWAYVSGSSGQTTLDTSGLSGDPYTAYLLAKDGYGILAETEPFSFAGPPTVDSIQLTTPNPYEGDKASFHWTTDAPDAKNWIGVYDGDRRPGHGAGGTEVAFTVTPNDFAGKEQTAWVKAGDRTRLTWRTDEGRYDVTVTAGTGTRFVQRYAGTVHAG
jgi:hypothetical protein